MSRSRRFAIVNQQIKVDEIPLPSKRPDESYKAILTRTKRGRRFLRESKKIRRQRELGKQKLMREFLALPEEERFPDKEEN